MKAQEEVFHDLCTRTDSPVSLGLWLRYCHAPKELATASIDPLDYNDAVSFGNDYACLSFLRKFKGLETGTDLRREALLRFGKSEDECSRTNERLRHSATTGQVDQVEYAILHRIQQLIAEIWGAPKFEELFSRCGWGPGSTSTLKGAWASREEKMSQFPISITPSAVDYFRPIIRHDYSWLRHLLKADIVGDVTLTSECFSLTSCSRVLTVPKDAKTDRTIAAEPTANIYLQKGIGGYLRARLQRYGINLNSQELNQQLAEKACFLGLSTLDLSAASDSISIEVVRLLCPFDMFNTLNRVRSPAFRRDGVETRFHKFSSMGNGFTFELETLIFFGVCKAIKEVRGVEGAIGVYGDDLIVPESIAEEVIATLKALGFEVNKEKSFIGGRFFESCGKHYFDGIDVTPPYQKEVPDNDLELIRMFNRISDWIYADEFEILGRRRRYGKVLTNLFKRLPEKLQKLQGYLWMEGDGFLRTPWADLPYNPYRRAYKLKYLKARGSRKRLADGGLFADSLRLLSSSTDVGDSEPSHGFVDIRPQGKVKTYTVARRWVHP